MTGIGLLLWAPRTCLAQIYKCSNLIQTREAQSKSDIGTTRINQKQRFGQRQNKQKLVLPLLLNGISSPFLFLSDESSSPATRNTNTLIHQIWKPEEEEKTWKMSDQLARAEEFEKKAEKKLASWGLFGSKFEDAADLYDKAANSYKLAKSCVFFHPFLYFFPSSIVCLQRKCSINLI